MSDIDVAIVGGGCIGLAAAKGLLERRDLDVAVYEKEATLAQHQSGRNSGVLHPGFNYEPGSRKARYATIGTSQLKSFAQEHDVPLDEVGVVVIATSAADEANLDLLFERADANDVEVEVLPDQASIAEHEPHAVGQRGLWCPTAASVDAPAYVEALAQVVRESGGQIHLDQPVEGLSATGDGVEVRLEDRTVTASHVLNAAGLYADTLAHQLEVGQGYRIVPFRGEYYELKPDRRQLTHSMIYPTPDPELPFLGVHFTRRADGSVIVGPNAVLAGGREAYQRYQIDPLETLQMLTFGGFWRLFGDRTVRSAALEHLHTSISKRAFVGAASQLVPAVREEDLIPGHAGIRAQIVSRDGTLVHEPLVEVGPDSTHVLNAVSPGLTASLPFGEELAETVIDQLDG